MHVFTICGRGDLLNKRRGTACIMALFAHNSIPTGAVPPAYYMILSTLSSAELDQDDKREKTLL